MKVTNFQFLKIHHPDRLVYFEDFRTAEVLLVQKKEDNYRLDVNINTYDGPYSTRERQIMEAKIGQPINNEYRSVGLSIQKSSVQMTSIEDLEKVEISIKKGWNEEAGNGIVNIYYEPGIELLKNEIHFSKEKGDWYLYWQAVSVALKQEGQLTNHTNYELKVKVKVIELESEDAIAERRTHMINFVKRYYEIIRNMRGKTMPKDLPLHKKLEAEYGVKHAKIAWEMVPETLEKFPIE